MGGNQSGRFSICCLILCFSVHNMTTVLVFRVLESKHLMFVHAVPFKVVAYFTLFQLVYLVSCFAWTWIPIGGVMFPILIMLLVPARQYVLPRFFQTEHLQHLDATDYQQAPSLPLNLALKVCSSHRLPLQARICVCTFSACKSCGEILIFFKGSVLSLHSVKIIPNCTFSTATWSRDPELSINGRDAMVLCWQSIPHQLFKVSVYSVLQ